MRAGSSQFLPFRHLALLYLSHAASVGGLRSFITCELSASSKIANPLASGVRAASSNHLIFVAGTRQTIMPDNESHSQRSYPLQSEDQQRHDWEKAIGVVEKNHCSERISVDGESDSV